MATPIPPRLLGNPLHLLSLGFGAGLSPKMPGTLGTAVAVLPYLALARLPLSRVREVHLAGYEDKGGYLIDAHNNPVSDPVWALYADLAARQPLPAVCIEWDNDIPSLEVLLGEVTRARTLAEAASGHAA